jgi:succinoglycan biosynthesis protein ExoA
MAVQGEEAPRLLVVIPCLNEEAHLPGLLDTLLADPMAEHALIVAADGGSTDRSIEIIEARAAADPRVRLLRNPKRLQSAGVNLAAATYGAGTEYLVRVDAHAGYPEDYLTRLVQACEESAADSVTVSMRAASHAGSCFQAAAAAAQNSVLGTGGSPHRAGGGRKWVDHGHHALFKTAAFRSVGGYDESFSHNEDAELDARLAAEGGRILLAADILIDYYPRTSALALARQYFKFGRGRARMLLRHRKLPKLRQLVTPAVLPAVALALLSPLAPWAGAPAAAWLAACLLGGALVGVTAGGGCALAAGVPAAIMHLAWSAGFWSHVLDVRRTAPRRRAEAAG